MGAMHSRVEVESSVSESRERQTDTARMRFRRLMPRTTLNHYCPCVSDNILVMCPLIFKGNNRRQTSYAKPQNMTKIVYTHSSLTIVYYFLLDWTIVFTVFLIGFIQIFLSLH